MSSKSMSVNRKIAINSIYIYIRLFVITVVSLFSTRYVLQALGVSDYGLYNVVASLISMLNCISTAMQTTTRRYINVEMGKKDGNLNKIFNVCLLLHFFFAIFILLIAETIGIWYINNYLNIAKDKVEDAFFVFQISTIISCIGIMNVPYKGLLEAYEKFNQTAFIDIIECLSKFVFVLLLLVYKGNSLRFYAVSMGFLSLASFLIYAVACYIQWRRIVQIHIYKGGAIYKEILVFNNYLSLGAFASIGRIQGSAILINFFFGTMVNAAYAVASQIQNFVMLFIGNFGVAAAPQITQNYSSGNVEKSIAQCSAVCRYTILLMIVVFFTLYTNIDYILKIWLGEIPEYCIPFCQWILIMALCNSFYSAIPTLVHATGKNKWFQISASIADILVLPVSFLLFKFGYSPVTIIITYTIVSIINKVVSLWLLKRIINFNSLAFVKKSYFRPFILIAILCISILLLEDMQVYGFLRICLLYTSPSPRDS